MKPEPIRYALVVYPDDPIGCIYLHAVPEAVARKQAIVIAMEDAELCVPVGLRQRYGPYMGHVILPTQQGADHNPRAQADGHTDDNGANEPDDSD